MQRASSGGFDVGVIARKLKIGRHEGGDRDIIFHDQEMLLSNLLHVRTLQAQ